MQDLVFALYVYVAPISWSSDPRALMGARVLARRSYRESECACK